MPLNSRLSWVFSLPLLALWAGAPALAAKNKAVEPVVSAHAAKPLAPQNLPSSPKIAPLSAIPTPVSPQQAAVPEAPKAAAPEALPPTQVLPLSTKGSAVGSKEASSPAETAKPQDFEAQAQAGSRRFDNAATKAPAPVPQPKIPPKAAKQAALLLQKTANLPVTFLFAQNGSDKRLNDVTYDTLMRPDAASPVANLIRIHLSHGNPGRGTKHVTGKIHYLRHDNGVRVFFRESGKGIEVLVIADKSNEGRAFKLLQTLYP